MRYYLLDKVTELKPGESATGIKCVTLTDDVLHDHFPDFPMLPGALLLESMSQLGGLLVEATFNPPTGPVRRAVLAQIQQAKFHRACEPGDRIELTATFVSRLESAARLAVEATVDSERAARAELTFILREVNSARVDEQRRSLYRLWTRHLKPPPDLR